ncbi:MAG TPA: TlpA disulfide reductase family protein [Candidatus Koribacter sp.]|jgi:thiol-disulfide isomerase/thioredoxin
MRRRIVAVALDVLMGLLAFGVFLGLDTYFHVASDLRTAVVSIAVLFVMAGLLRGRDGSAWRQGLQVSAGGVLVMFALLWAAIFHTTLAVLLLTAVLFAVCGVRARQYWANHLPVRGSLTIFAPLAAVVIIALTAMPRLAGGVATRQTATPAPAFAVSRLDGSIVHSTDWHGRVVVIDYWATWCPACRRELPELEKLYRGYRNNPEVVFWAVDVQQNGENPEKASAFFQKASYSLPIAIDSENSADLLTKRFAFEGFPALIVIDRDGRVRLVHIGYDRAEHLGDNLSKKIQELLKEPA